MLCLPHRGLKPGTNLFKGAELTFKAAGSFIKLDASGVTLVGPQIKINSGGGPGSGTGATPILPGKALKADSDKAGALLTLSLIHI